jgi:hypothetical protein
MFQNAQLSHESFRERIEYNSYSFSYSQLPSIQATLKNPVLTQPNPYNIGISLKSAYIYRKINKNGRFLDGLPLPARRKKRNGIT